MTMVFRLDRTELLDPISSRSLRADAKGPFHVRPERVRSRWPKLELRMSASSSGRTYIYVHGMHLHTYIYRWPKLELRMSASSSGRTSGPSSR